MKQGRAEVLRSSKKYSFEIAIPYWFDCMFLHGSITPPNTKELTEVFTMLLHLCLFATIIPCSLSLFKMMIKFFKADAAKNSIYNLNLQPGPKKLPLIGNLHQLIGPELLHNRLNNLARVYGPIYRLKAGELAVIVLSSREAAKEVLKTQEINFVQGRCFNPSR